MTDLQIAHGQAMAKAYSGVTIDNKCPVVVFKEDTEKYFKSNCCQGVDKYIDELMKVME